MATRCPATVRWEAPSVTQTPSTASIIFTIGQTFLERQAPWRHLRRSTASLLFICIVGAIGGCSPSQPEPEAAGALCRDVNESFARLSVAFDRLESDGQISRQFSDLSTRADSALPDAAAPLGRVANAATSLLEDGESDVAQQVKAQLTILSAAADLSSMCLDALGLTEPADINQFIRPILDAVTL